MGVALSWNENYTWTSNRLWLLLCEPKNVDLGTCCSQCYLVYFTLILLVLCGVNRKPHWDTFYLFFFWYSCGCSLRQWGFSPLLLWVQQRTPWWLLGMVPYPSLWSFSTHQARKFVNRHGNVQIIDICNAHIFHIISGIKNYFRWTICFDFTGCVGPGKHG